MLLTPSQTRALLDVMVRTTHQKRDNLGHMYLGRAGDGLPRYLAEYLESERRAQVREDLLRFAGPLARTDARVRELAARALRDRSAKVRKVALWLLAQSADLAMIPMLTNWRPPTPLDAEYRDRAILAIERQDVQEWVRGTVYDEVIPWQFCQHEVDSAEFHDEVDYYIKRLAADLVPDLDRALGDLYLGGSEDGEDDGR